MTVSIQKVAAYLVSKQDQEAGDPITHLKLQKLAYYAEAWHLAVFDEPLTGESFEAWIHGPVSRHLYAVYGDYGLSPIPEPRPGEYEGLSENIRDFLEEVWDVYGSFGAKHLEHLTHKEEPWLEARRGLSPIAKSRVPISPDTMKRFYRDLAEQHGEERA